MDNTRDTVLRLSGQLHLCLFHAVNTALTESMGEKWFQTFEEFDRKQEKPVLEKTHHSPASMDLQAYLKFFRFRWEYATKVFAYYGNDFNNSKEAEKSRRMLNQLLDNLIHNVRNDICAHPSAEMTANSDNHTAVYGTREAINDILRLASFFPQVKDEKGQPYYEKMCALARPMTCYPIAEVLRKESISMTVGSFADICSALSLKVITNEQGQLSFLSENYAGDIARIKLYIKEHFAPKPQLYRVQDVIQREMPHVEQRLFIEACQVCGIPISTGRGNELLISTVNYANDIARIKAYLQNKAPQPTEPKKKKSPIGWILGIAAAILLIGAITLGIVSCTNGNSEDTFTTGSKNTSESTSQTSSDSTIKDNTEADTTTTTQPKAHIFGSTEYYGLVLTIDQEESKTININYENGDNSFTRSWTGAVWYTVETVSGEKFTVSQEFAVNDKKIIPNSSGTLEVYFSELNEDIKTITIEHICRLNDSGFPIDMNNAEPIVIEINYD